MEKVYPIGSYYWSSNNKSPSEIFGGSWTKINGRFLFASDNNHSVGEMGGEERHYLTINEIPSHSHTYEKFRYDITHAGSGNYHIHGEYFPYAKKDYDYYRTESTTSIGGGNSHNNMPPFLTANCWKRTG